MKLPPKFAAWLSLGRVANLPSAIANVWMGMLLGAGGWSPWSQWLLLSLSSAALYTAGMILNDWWDVGKDSLERPERPLPSGRIGVTTAGVVGFGLLGLGVAAATCAGRVDNSTLSLRPFVVASLLALAIVLYDIVLKRTPFAPWLMGVCRGLNVLLGASVSLNQGGWSGIPEAAWWIGICLAIYVAGITWIARSEAGEIRRGPLVLGAALILLALLGYAGIVRSPQFLQRVGGARSLEFFPLLILAIGFPILRRALRAIKNLQPRTVQGAVITALRSMIVLDASVCIVAGQGSLIYGLAVLALLPVGLLLNSVSRHT